MKFFLVICKLLVVRNKKQQTIQLLLCNNIEPQQDLVELCVEQSLWFPIQDYGMDRNTWYFVIREVLLEEPYKYKKGSNKKGKKWTDEAEALNKSEEVKFKVTQRGVRERMEGLQRKHLEKKKEEESASDIAVDDVT